MTVNNKHIFMKKNLPLAISMATGLSLFIGAISIPAMAQNTEAGQPLEEIIITGQRRSIESAQMIKRDAEVFVDSVTAIDIGALPDRSVSEALQRIPGVQLQRTNENRDPARLAAEGGAVFVRGLSWVRTELNGRDIFGATSGRTLGFEDVSADLMAGVDVYKSPSANMIEGGIGGVVNLRTRLPFDSNDMILAGSVDYNYAELYEKGFTSVNGLFSNSWETDIGKVGFLVSASIAEIGNRTDSISTGRWMPYTLQEQSDDDGNTWLAWDTPHEGATPEEIFRTPTGLGFRRIDWEQERTAYSTALQWSPNEDFTITLQALHAEASPEDVERGLGINADWGADINPGHGDFQFSGNNDLQSGVLNNSTLVWNTRYGKRESTTTDVSLGFEWAPSHSNWNVKGSLQNVDSTAKVLSMSSFTALAPGGGPQSNSGQSVHFDLRNTPWINVGGEALHTDPANYWWGAAMDHIEDNSAESIVGQIDLEYSFDEGFIQSISFGGRVSDRDTLTRQSGWNWSIVSQQYWGGVADPVTIAEHATEWAELYEFDNFYGGSVPVPAVGWLAKKEMVSSNHHFGEVMSDVLASTIGELYWGWSPLSAPGAYDLNPQGDNVSAGINQQNEKTSAAYVMVRFADGGDLLGIPFDGNFGIRVVDTNTDARGRSGAGGISEECNASSTEACTGATAFVSAFNDLYGDYANYSNDYTNVLPSLNLRFHLTDNVQARFGLSKSMSRPAFYQTRPYTNVQFAFQGEEFDPNQLNSGTVGTITEGSPDLKATTADQIDASLEWYFTDSGSLTFSAFYKKVKDYVSLQTINDERTFGGETYTFEITRQVNGEEGTLQGFEIAYQQFFDRLPEPFDGLGFQTNFTYISNDGGANTAVNLWEESNGDYVQRDGANNRSLPIEGMSRTSYNIALMYEKYDVSARLAYNWRERYLLTTSAANINRPVWFDDYGQLDASVFYTFNERWKAGLQVTNLLAEETTLDVGTNLTHSYSWTQGDRRMAFVIRGQF